MIGTHMESRRRTAGEQGREGKPRLEFREIHRLYRPKIFRYLTRLVGRSEAEDLTQEVFLKVSRALRNFRGGSQISTWIYRIATNAALDELRKPSFSDSRSVPFTENPGEMAEAGRGAEVAKTREEEEPSPAESSLIQKEMLDCLLTHIDKLPPNHRAVVVLGVLEGMKNREIAEILGISLETVKIRLHRGRSRLVQELEAHCGWYRDKRNRRTWDGKIL